MFRIFVAENKKIMETVRQIQKFGDNLGVCFPQVIETITSDSTYNLSDILSKITENNTHQSIDTCEPIGGEIW